MMKLYDAMILRVRELTEGLPARAYAYEEKKAWPENKDFEMIFQKDVAYELGGGNAPCANLTCVTEDEALFAGEWPDAATFEAGESSAASAAGRKGTLGDQILVVGPDLQEIQGDVSYARICEVLVRGVENPVAEGAKDASESPAAEGMKDTSESPAAEGAKDMQDEAVATLTLLQDIDFEKFHVYGKGFMMRTSGQSPREQVRVSRKALQEGITFEKMGDVFISHYKKNPRVLAVRVIFITEKSFDYDKLSQEAKLAVEIRNSLSKIQKGLPTECSVCDVREICNEVEGLRELHFGKKEKAGTDPASSKKRIL